MKNLLAKTSVGLTLVLVSAFTLFTLSTLAMLFTTGILGDALAQTLFG